VSQKVTEAAQTTAAGAAQTPEGTQRPEQVQTTAAETAQTPEGTQRPEAAGTQEVRRKVSLEVQTPEQRSSEVGRRMSLEACSEVSRKVSLELRRFATQQIPQELPYRWSDENLTHYLPEDRYLPEDLAYQYHQEGRCQQGLSAR
jgi:hypothetical protein